MIRALGANDLDAVYTAFTEAFSDYVVPLTLTREQLVEMLTRRGYVAGASVAACEGDRIVAFTLNGIDGGRAYDSGTGVVPSHRGRGLGRAVMEESITLLRARGCTSYVLEVIDSNAPAIALYRGLGFAETRGLQCWTYARGSAEKTGIAFEEHGASDDILPSWQNDDASLARARDTWVRIGDDDAFAIVFPRTGDVPQLRVAPGLRRRGHGRRLFHETAALAEKPLRFINVDDRNPAVAAFLTRLGATRSVRQLELLRPL